MDEIAEELERPITVLSGCSRGADFLGEHWAFHRGHSVERHPAQWKIHGKAAGPIRNREMIARADSVAAFWDGSSPGTLDLLRSARRAGLTIWIIPYTGERIDDYAKLLDQRTGFGPLDST